MPFRPAPTRGSAPIDKSKKPAFRDASQVTHVRDINTVGSYVSTNGVLTSVKKAMQAATGGNFVLSSTDFRAETDSRILQNRLQQPLTQIPGTGNRDGFIIQYNSGGMVNWQMAFGGNEDDYGYSVGHDSDGNIIIVGGGNSNIFRVTDRTGIIRLSGSVNQTGQHAGHVIKYDSNGTPLWISYYYGGGGFYKSYNDLTTDSAGNIYVVGNAQGGIGVITNGNGTVFPSNGNFTFSSSGAHLIKYNPSGFVQWIVKVDGGGNNDGANGASTDSNGNVTMVGSYLTDCIAYNADGSAFSPSTGYDTGGSGMFAVQYTSAGTVNWFARITASNGGFGNGVACTTDLSGNINAVFGIYNTPILIYNRNGSTGTLFRTLSNMNGYSHGYIVQYSPTGNVNWATKIAGSTNGPHDIAIGAGYTDTDTDTLGNVISCGRYSGGSLYIENSDGNRYLAIISASSSGTATTYNTITAHNLNVNQSITISGTTNGLHNVSSVIASVPTPTSFTINNTVAIGQVSLGGFGYIQPGNYYANGFILKYNSSGFVQWFVVCTSGDGSDSNDNSAMTISVDRSNNNINVTGHFTTGSITFYNANGSVARKLFNTNRGSKDLYIVQYSPEGNVNWASLSSADLVYGSDTDGNGNVTISGGTYAGVVSYDKTGLPASKLVYPVL